MWLTHASTCPPTHTRAREPTATSIQASLCTRPTPLGYQHARSGGGGGRRTCMQARRTGWTAHWSWWAERLCASSGLQSEGSSGFLHSSSSSSACCTPSLSHPAAGCCAWCATIEGASCCAPPCPPPPPSARALDADVGESAGESASTRGEGGREERRAEDAAGAREGAVVEREEEEREGERARAAGRAQRMRSSSVSFSPSGCFTPARSAHALACTRARSASLAEGQSV
eukprot:3020075-Rhodomonas_salina.2